MWGWPVLEQVAKDAAYALRALRRTPGFTAAAVVTLALGIGVNTAVFSVVNGVLLNPLPYPVPDQLLALYSRTADGPRVSSSYPNFLDWVRDNRSFSHLAAFRPDDLNLIGVGQPERVPAEMVSASFFRLFGVQPILGRTFLPTDDQLGAATVVLISENFWKRKFDSSPTAIGQALTLSGTSYVIIGVIPATFRYDARNFHHSDVYVPIGSWNAPGFRNRKVSMGMDVVGRLKPGVSLERADGDMQALARGLADQYPQVNKGTGITLVPLKSDLVGPVKPLLLLLIVIDDQFARRQFGDQDPIGRRINIDILNITAEIVGVVGHVRQWGLDENAASAYQAQCYLSMFQLPGHVMPLAARDSAMVFRTADAPLAQVGPIRRALEQINGQLVMYREQAMGGVISDRLATRRFSMIVLGVFAALALLMACVGIYGVISHLVGERTHEIAIRMALGAERWDVLRMVLRDGAKMALAGVAIGFGAALGLTRLMTSMLFGISAHDPVTVAGVVSLLVFVAVAACCVPARRAIRIDPMVALRND